jgi:hypothetical protein
MAANLMPNPQASAQEMNNLQQATTALTTEFGHIGDLPASSGAHTVQQQATQQMNALQQQMTAFQQ